MRGGAHLLLTRFNVPVPFAPAGAAPGLDAEWLRHRFALFERFCLPSVRSQSGRDFQWLVFFHEDTPGEWRERIEAYAELPALRPVFVRRLDHQTVFRAVERALPTPPPLLVTSRLDNDDALARHFVSEVQRHVGTADAPYFLNFPRGYTWVDGRAYLYRHGSNAFLTLVEPISRWSADAVRTVWCCEHAAAGAVAPVRQLGDRPGWMQVIHGRNAANRRVGTRRPLRAVRADFDLPDDGARGSGDESLWWLDAAWGRLRAAGGRLSRLVGPALRARRGHGA